MLESLDPDEQSLWKITIGVMIITTPVHSLVTTWVIAIWDSWKTEAVTDSPEKTVTGQAFGTVGYWEA